MNLKSNYFMARCTRRLALALAATTMATAVVNATPYATSVTNNAGLVSFRLNEDATSVAVVGNNGTVSNYLGFVTKGLTVTNLASSGITSGIIKVVVSTVGSGAITTNTPVAFNSPRGVTVNVNPASPYFGRVYVANSTAGTKGDGIFVFNSDLSDTFGQAATPRTGGIPSFGTGGNASPYRIKVGKDDDRLYVCDWSDASGNLWSTDPDVSDGSSQYVLRQLTGIADPPVGLDNNHGSVAAVEVTGSLAGGDLKVFAVDEDYQTDPSRTSKSEMNSLWEYDISSGPLPWSNAPTTKLLTPIGSTSQTMDLARGPNGYLYASDYRSAGNEAGVFVVDGTGNLLFNSKSQSLTEGFSTDILKATGGLAVSPDGKYLAAMNYENNVVTVVPLVDGIPNLSQRFQFTGFGTTAAARGIAFDAANNLYIVSSGLAILNSLSLGFTATVTTGSDGTFTLATPATQVSLAADTDTVFEASPAGETTFTITRAGSDMSQPLQVNFFTSGTAVRGSDYVLKTNGVALDPATAVVIPAGVDNVQVTLAPVDDTVSELTETAILNLASGGSYNAVAPAKATVAIVDNDTPMVDVSVVSNSMYERLTNDYARYRLTRRGETNSATLDVNVVYSGTAKANIDFTPVSPVTIEPGVVNQNFDVHPVDNLTYEGTRTLIAAVAAGTGYLVGTNNTTPATATIVDDETAPETVLWSDNFNADSSANWKLFYGATNADVADYTATFAYDYSAEGIPPAPHSGADTHGLKVTVNKNDDVPSGAGVNLYPLGRNFSGNFALRFDMYLTINSSSGTTEHGIFGINHSGNQTNWFRGSGTGVPQGTTYDGLWFQVEEDAGALGDYVLNTSPTLNSSGFFGPTSPASRLASTLTSVFKVPPFAAAGAPANQQSSTTPSWTDVEVSQIGKIVTLKINNTVVMTYSNTTAYTSGNIMLGYDDAYDSVGNGSAGAGEASVIFDNVRVVSISGMQISSISTAGTNAVINFTFDLPESSPASAFKVQSATSVQGPYADATATITQVSPGVYQATVGMSGAQRFYRIRHQ